MSRTSEDFPVSRVFLNRLGCDLTTLANASELQRLSLLRIRNLEGVSRYMYDDQEISELTHHEWCDRVSRSETDHVFVVTRSHAVIGQLGFRSISWVNSRCDWAFFLDPEMHGKGIGSAVEQTAIEHAFRSLKLSKLNCEVLAFNNSVIEMHRRFGFRIEGVRREFVRRNGVPIDAILLGMTSEEYFRLAER